MFINIFRNCQILVIIERHWFDIWTLVNINVYYEELFMGLCQGYHRTIIFIWLWVKTKRLQQGLKCWFERISYWGRASIRVRIRNDFVDIGVAELFKCFIHSMRFPNTANVNFNIWPDVKFITLNLNYFVFFFTYIQPCCQL